ncbi:MAG: hypothetical protein R2706_03805 [Acidimicrobiales bacterium]
MGELRLTGAIDRLRLAGDGATDARLVAVRRVGAARASCVAVREAAGRIGIHVAALATNLAKDPILKFKL